jgi:hypothetical protein
MQFSKYILTLALLAVLAEATEQSSISMNKENVKQTVSKASTVAHSHETPKATLEYHDYGHGYGDKDYDSGKSTQIYEDEDYDKTVTYKYDHTTKATHGDKSQSSLRDFRREDLLITVGQRQRRHRRTPKKRTRLLCTGCTRTEATTTLPPYIKAL